MSFWREWVTENPMRVEVVRLRRKFLSVRGPNPAISAAVGLFFVLYLLMVLVIWMMRGVLHPNWVVMIQTMLVAFLGPVLLHTSIAGEREARSWEMLLCAPVTTAQIVAGKILGAMGVLLAACLLFLLPVGIAALTYNTGILTSGMHSLFGPQAVGPAGSRLARNLLEVAIAEAQSISFAMAVCAMTVFFSGRCRRALTALGMSLGGVFFFFGFLPFSLAVLGGPIIGDVVVQVSPVVAIAAMTSETGSNPLGYVASVISSLFLAAVFILWTSKTLIFADNQVGFLPKAKRDA